ncbi:MAG TPA: erythromycin biosynthesis sensory transduction protein eryC1 [Candidatus Omnitrophica bacterium]|nr:erythromycin biosynthesis sensory transduction protein eryC1 [Candidatus Omnitrophota bacterium]
MIPFVDLKAQYHSIAREVDIEMRKVLEQTNFILGEPVAAFEKEFAVFCDSKYCIGVASGTDALHLALRALGIGPGDEVIAPANTFVATVLAISYVGARPVLVDVDPQTFNIDFDDLEKKITPKTKVIVPVHLYGRVLNMDHLMALAKKHGIKVVEDACQAHGAVWEGKKAGSFGTMGCFSFYPGKNLGAYGDAGAIVTSDEALSNSLKMLRNYGSPKKYYHDSQGYNSRLDTLQAAILRVKLKHIVEWNRKRFLNAQLYYGKLRGVGDIILPDIPSIDEHVFHLFVIRTKQRDGLLKFLQDRQVQAGIHYPVPIYALGAYTHLGLTADDYPVTEKLSKEILSLPMYPELLEAQIDEVAGCIRDFFIQ